MDLLGGLGVFQSSASPKWLKVGKVQVPCGNTNQTLLCFRKGWSVFCCDQQLRIASAVCLTASWQIAK